MLHDIQNRGSSMKKQLKISILTLANVASLIACIYYFTAAFNPLVGFVCGAVFLFAFITAIQMTPKPQGTCPHCGKRL